ncbi:MAG: FG-GAP-like repeat-containing protein [Ignavibacteria bacterium]|nr:FG-GAP-like repeat-containing protein [Ignavibacteria bacterium]
MSEPCSNCHFGETVSKAGDVNGDGYDDVIVVDNSFFYSGAYFGKIYVYYGSPKGPHTTAGWTVTGLNYNVTLGSSAISAGDINGDGYDDIIIGSKYINFSLTKTFVFNGIPTGLQNNPSWIDSSLSIYGGTYTGLKVSGAGDVNGDGYSDVLIAHDGNIGRVKLFLGSSAGLNSSATLVKQGLNANDEMGHSFSSAGDVNGDGYDDIIISQNISPSKIFFGSSYGIDSTITWNLNPGCDVAYAGDVNGDGYDDCYAANEGTSYVYMGKPDIRKLNLKLLIQGFYDSLANINTPDTLRLYLRKSVFPYSIIDSSKTILNSGGEAEFKLLHTAKNLDFYIVTKHRNTIEPWRSVPVRFIDSLMAYNFSDSKANAYVNNQTKVKISPLRYALFSGDVNQDGIIDASDMAEVDNDAYNGLTGYVKSDLTGDNFVDAQDLSIVDNNSFNAVIVIRP